MSGDIAVPAYETYVEDDLREALAEICAANDEGPESGTADAVGAGTGEGGAKKQRTHKKKASRRSQRGLREERRGKGRSSLSQSGLQMRYVNCSRSSSSLVVPLLSSAPFHMQYAVFVSMYLTETKAAMPELKGNQIWQYMGAQWRELSRVGISA